MPKRIILLESNTHKKYQTSKNLSTWEDKLPPPLIPACRVPEGFAYHEQKSDPFPKLRIMTQYDMWFRRIFHITGWGGYWGEIPNIYMRYMKKILKKGKGKNIITIIQPKRRGLEKTKLKDN